ncbi:MAG: hypothetical protein B7C24_16465 [Bacteroidetes bacterium 4572_77]|nr:MAG: hypothetical protein B7C24_16465 [Bacteroidetes bacterium 4572_77]
MKFTSEEILDIAKPPLYQCSKIDSFILNGKCIKETGFWGQQETDVKTLQECLANVESDAFEIEKNFEELREALEDLRLWGQEWKVLAKQMIRKYEPDLLKQTSVH